MTFQYDETGKRIAGEYRLNPAKLYAILETINSNHFTDITLSERAINIYGMLDISVDYKEEGCLLGELMSKREGIDMLYLRTYAYNGKETAIHTPNLVDLLREYII